MKLTYMICEIKLNYTFTLFLMIGFLLSCDQNPTSETSTKVIEIDSAINIEKVDDEESEKWYYSLEEALKEPLQVKNLSLREQGFKEFPEEIIQFRNLEDLDISMNDFTHLSDSIGKLENLKSLSCSYGYLNRLPASIGSLNKLERLWLLDNNLKYLPEEIGSLSSLKGLNLFLNPIEYLPKTFFQLQNLEDLGFQSPDYGPVFSKEKQKEIQEKLPNCKIEFGGLVE